MRILASLSSILLASLFPAVLSAQGPNVSGTWVSESNASLKWVIEQTPEAIHIQEINADKREADFTCPLGGRVCDVKEDHRSEKVMIYFNSGKLVEIRDIRLVALLCKSPCSGERQQHEQVPAITRIRPRCSSRSGPVGKAAPRINPVKSPPMCAALSMPLAQLAPNARL